MRDPKPDFERAFQAAAKGRANALITITSTLLFREQKEIAAFALKNRLPSMFEEKHMGRERRPYVLLDQRPLKFFAALRRT